MAVEVVFSEEVEGALTGLGLGAAIIRSRVRLAALDTKLEDPERERRSLYVRVVCFRGFVLVLKVEPQRGQVTVESIRHAGLGIPIGPMGN